MLLSLIMYVFIVRVLYIIYCFYVMLSFVCGIYIIILILFIVPLLVSNLSYIIVADYTCFNVHVSTVLVFCLLDVTVSILF